MKLEIGAKLAAGRRRNDVDVRLIYMYMVASLVKSFLDDKVN